jgi:protein-S-isoprenylcysteine O-methyltransferase Ste14
MSACCQPWLLASGRFFFRIRNALFPVLLVAMLAATRPAQFLDSPILDAAAIAAGVLLLLGGQTFRMLVIGYAYIRRGGRNREVFANELVTRGFYAHCRNPMYVGNFSVVAGFSLIYGSAWGYALLAPLFAYIYLAITTAEETYLRDKFGAAYDDYARRVNRFLLNPRGIRKSLAEFSYDWQRALVKEYGTLCFTLLALLGLLAWKIAWVYGYAAHKNTVLLLCAAGLPVGIFYGVIRYLKLTKRLRAARKEETEEAIEPG